MADPNHWQPLVYVNSTGDLMTQPFPGSAVVLCDSICRCRKEMKFRWLGQNSAARYLRLRRISAAGEELVALSAG